MAHRMAIGVDFGATNLKVALVDSKGTVESKRECPTAASRGPDAVIADLARLAESSRGDAPDGTDLVGVGVGAPGPISHRMGMIVRSNNLPGWSNVRLRDRLQDKLGLRVTLDNDGNVAAFGEYWVGAGEQTGDLVMLTLGTGVGGGVVLNEAILHGHFENAAELGHMIVSLDGLQCSCGQRGCLEQYASASAVARRVNEAIQQGESKVLSDAVSSGQVIDAEWVVRYAREGNAVCLRIWNEACFYLAAACINIQRFYNPARIVFGGGMSRAGGFLLDSIREHLGRQKSSTDSNLPEITLAKLGHEAGVIGAAHLALKELAGDE